MAISTKTYIEKPTDINWATLNDSFENCDVDEMELCDLIFTGHPFCAWMDGRRSEEHFLQAQHLGVDMDTEDYRSSMDALASHPLVQQYGAIIYQTPTHQSHAPKSRVVFLLDEPITTAGGYRLALETVYSLFDGADSACVDPSRFFFGNGKLAEERNTAGIWFSEICDFPLSDLRTFARQYIHNSKTEHSQNTSRTAPEQRPNGHHVSLNLDDITVKLGKVDAYAIDYRMWVKVCAGLKAEFGDAAFPVARNWSEAPNKTSLSEKKWGSFGRSGTPVTIATVLKVIKEHGR